MDSQDTHKLTDSIKEEIRRAYKAVAESQPGFKHRRCQRHMIAEVSKTLSGDYGSRLIAVEAPTGTGKSLAYGLAALPVAKARDKHLVISTATVALQDQIMHKDLPNLRAFTDMEFSFELAKGRGRYVCDRELNQLTGAGAGQVDIEDDSNGDDQSRASIRSAAWKVKPKKGEPEMVARMAEARADKSWNGDLDDWDQPVRAPVKAMLTSTTSSCTNRRCAYFAQCPYYLAREQRKGADVIVANHALVVADLMMGGGAVLPHPSETIFIFDEGHNLPGVALEQDNMMTRLKGPRSWLENIDRINRDLFQVLSKNQYLDKLRELADNIDGERTHLIDALEDLHKYISDAYPQELKDKGEIWRFKLGRIDDPQLVELFQRAHGPARLVEKLLDAIKKLIDEAQKNDDVVDTLISPVRSNLVWTLERVSNSTKALDGLGTVDDPDRQAPPNARWIEPVKDGDDFQCSVSPVSSAQALHERLWSVCDGAVVTSATLTSLGRFDRLCEQSGLNPQTTRMVRLESPFDYPNKAQLHIPAVKASPRDRTGYTKEIIDRLNAGLIDPDEATLVLFTSYWQMNEVHDGLDETLQQLVLKQGNASRRELLQIHRERVDNGRGSIVMGVASFSEGLDLPGRQCTHVIVTKLPFSVPTHPVESTYAGWLETNNRNPFLEMSVPDASFRLIQACGRLIRSESDYGRVTILDRRLVEKPYGRAMLNSLPPFKRFIETKAA